MFKNMSMGMRILLGIVVSVIVFIGMVVLWAVISYISANNYAGPMEEAIIAKHKDSQNVFSNAAQKIMTAAQVPEMYRDDLTKVMQSAITARYGKDGSKAAFQWIQEAQIPFDSKLYTNLQQIIESSRNDFQSSQTAKLDLCRQYNGQLTTIPRGWFMKFAGYPSAKLNSISHVCDAVTDDATEKAFTSGKQETLVLRNSAKK